KESNDPKKAVRFAAILKDKFAEVSAPENIFLLVELNGNESNRAKLYYYIALEDTWFEFRPTIFKSEDGSEKTGVIILSQSLHEKYLESMLSFQTKKAVAIADHSNVFPMLGSIPPVTVAALAIQGNRPIGLAYPGLPNDSLIHGKPYAP